MGSRSGTASGEAPLPAARESEEGSRSDRPVPATILLLAVWIGLIAGFLDLGLHGPQEAPDRRGTSTASATASPGSSPRGSRRWCWCPGRCSPWSPGCGARASLSGSPWGCSRSSGSSTCARGCPWSSGRRCCCPAGLAVQSARLVGRRRRGFLRLRPPDDARCSPGPCWSSPLATSGGRAWSEHRAAAALPPPPARRPERAADRLGHGPGQEPEPPRLRPPDDAQPRAAGRPRGAVRACVRDVVLDPAVARQPVHRAVAPRAFGRLEDAARRHPSHARRTPRLPRL